MKLFELLLQLTRLYLQSSNTYRFCTSQKHRQDVVHFMSSSIGLFHLKRVGWGRWGGVAEGKEDQLKNIAITSGHVQIMAWSAIILSCKGIQT